MEDRPILVRSIINCDCPEIKRFLDRIVPRYVESPDPVFDFAFPNFQENDDDEEGFFLQNQDFHEETSLEEIPLSDDMEFPVAEHMNDENHPEDFLVEYRALLRIGNLFKLVVLVGIYRSNDFPEPESFDSDSEIEE